MRICINVPDDQPGWEVVSPKPELHVYLEEKLVRHVIAVDDVRGEIWTHKKNSDGTFVIENESTVMEKLTGNVQIRVGDWSR